MSFRVLGYTAEGHRITEDQGPAHASMSASRGGLTLGQALSSVTVAHKGLHNRGEPKLRREKLARWYFAAPRCGRSLSGGPCARAAGHAPDCRTRAQMDAENARRLGR